MCGSFRDLTETLVYTYRMKTGYAPLLIVVGIAGEVLDARQSAPTTCQQAQAGVVLLDAASHMGVVVVDVARLTVPNRLQKM